MTPLMEATARVAREAGAVALRHFRTQLTVETKSDGSPVTIADRQAEEAARAILEELFPEDGVLGEELGLTRSDAPRRWIIDPIDGTKSFVHGVPLWGTLVALVEGEAVLSGAAYFPAVDELVVAAPGAGCLWNGRPARVSPIDDLARATVLTTDERFLDAPACAAPYRTLAGSASLSRGWGDCYGYLLVATGRAELMTDGTLSPWDAASLMPIIEEAGGVFTDWRGRRTAFGQGVIATNRALAARTRSLLGVPEGGDLT